MNTTISYVVGRIEFCELPPEARQWKRNTKWDEQVRYSGEDWWVLDNRKTVTLSKAATKPETAVALVRFTAEYRPERVLTIYEVTAVPTRRAVLRLYIELGATVLKALLRAADLKAPFIQKANEIVADIEKTKRELLGV